MDTTKRHGAFISYSRSDSEIALELANELRSAGYPVWLDQLDIPTGARWDDEVEKALRDHEIFLIILTPASVSSENVKDEIGYAIDHGKRIMPVLLKNCDIPLRLRRFQYVDFTKINFIDGVRRAKQLLETLTTDRSTPMAKINSGLDAQRVSKVEAPVAAPSPIPNKPIRRQRISVIAGVIALGTCIGALGAIILFRDYIFGSQAPSTVEAISTSITQTPLSDTPTSLESTPTDSLTTECVDSSLWRTLTKVSIESNNCLSLNEWGIFTKDNKFTISMNSSNEVIRQGIFMPISNGAQVRLKLTISTLYTPYDNNLANLSMGIISINSHDLETDTLLIYQKESPRDGYPIYVKTRERGGFDAYLTQSGDYRKYTENTTQEILLELSETNLLTIYIDGTQVIQTVLSFQDKAFWIGYRLPENGQINAEISDFQIQ
jgi:hypothetical protein